jgi:GNAT superfamily N-acetyltransferase
VTATPLMYQIRLATEEDVSSVVGLRVHAEKWLAAAGIEQWTVRATGEKNIRAHIERGATFVVQVSSSEVVGTLTLDGGDPDFWTPEELSAPAAYLYKFIIDSHYRGSGLGDVMLNWACKRAATHGATTLRLDCWKTNFELHKYYLRRGFRQFDIRDAPGRMSGALFERPTSLQLPLTSALRLVDLTDDRQPTTGSNGMDANKDQYDPTGEAAIWLAAADVVRELKLESIPGDQHRYWNTALEQAERALDTKAREIRQAGGMYYRPMNGIPKED